MTTAVLARPEAVRVPGPDTDTGKWSARYSVAVGAGEPVFAGHYPDFAIFPGVCVLECVRAAAEASVPPAADGVRFAAVESCRFLAAVHPGDVLDIELVWEPRGADWRCTAKVATGRGPAASVRCRYRCGDAA
ncbi:hypothetical protein [Streptomyces sp. B1I3]|uniref:hypothetical protein n=1 Tax=Streptomyces sp. B1I3 TaxID=3042264 RepID=UPI00277DD131|nr:hypothetical protein [Streptomyces sp. B1I3]MDQ0795503.1 3-hydroxyacyl-[acyl-carrier-protein] dehydratase [Streptomyces sp. B1I3]